MLTKLTIHNFKRFEGVAIELGDPVVFIGPNNSGKTSALQVLALWEAGIKKWNEKRKGKTAPEKRPGVTINRKNLTFMPVPYANLLWRNLHVRDVLKVDGKMETKNVRIKVIVEGVTEGKEWKCGLEFDYANEESFYCRPLLLSTERKSDRMPIPSEAEKIEMAFLPPMSGLSANETRLDHGAINVRIGEGRTAEVLRNLCYRIFNENKDNWEKLISHIKTLFGSELAAPEYIEERGEIKMNYKEKDTSFDLSSAGRGLHQTLLLLSYMYANPGAVLLLDEPDAHLEILRQRQIYQLLVDVAKRNGNQVIIASHSEVLLNEAADRDVVVAFVGNPHRIDNRGRGSQVLKSLREIGFEQYYQAEQTGWVLYLEGSNDLAVLREFANKLKLQKALQVLERPFVHYVGNQPEIAKKHFYGLKEAYPQLLGIAIFDQLENVPVSVPEITYLAWEWREIENYLCYPETLEAYALGTSEQEALGPLFAPAESERRLNAMKESIREVEQALNTLRKVSPWDKNTKISDDFLVPLFEIYFKKLGLSNIMAKKNFHELVQYVPRNRIVPEVKEKLEAIIRISNRAKPIK